MFEDCINCSSTCCPPSWTQWLKATPLLLACSVDQKRCNLFGENLIRFMIPLQISKVFLRHTSFRPASWRHKFKECAQQCSGIAPGCSLRILIASPVLLPCILAAPSYPYHRHNASGRSHRMRRSLMTLKRVSAFVSGNLNRPIGSS